MLESLVADVGLGLIMAFFFVFIIGDGDARGG
jgi:hypothetical protein